MPTFEYVAQRIHPRQGRGPAVLLFAAPAGDIRTWAGVPRKAFDYQHGFQRTLDPRRVEEVQEYFNADPRNVSPTSVVLGFTTQLTVSPITQATGLGVDLIRIRIDVPDLGGLTLAGVAELAANAIRSRLTQTQLEAIEADTATAVSEANRLEDAESVDEAFGILDDESANATAATTEADRSYLADFYAQLVGYLRGLMPWPDAEQLREVLYSFLKPAIIVDGQHRVFGAANVDESMLLSVCGLLDSSWAENVYQFVVINQRAKPIKPAFLSSIIATSLSTEEIQTVYKRLHSSHVDVERAQMMDQINTDPQSPFRGMIDFEVEGSPGFLKFPGMARLATTFYALPRSHPVLVRDGGWLGSPHSWIEYFFALWTGVRRYFETADPRLWQQPSESNPNHLLMIVTLQEIQRLMLDTWADGRAVKFVDINAVSEAAHAFWDGFPSTFFTDEWVQKGLQTQVGRSMLRDAILDTRRNSGRKNWGHRRLRLFSK